MISHFIPLENKVECPHCGSKAKELIAQSMETIILPLIWDEDGKLLSDKNIDPLKTVYYCLSCQTEYEVFE